MPAGSGSQLDLGQYLGGILKEFPSLGIVLRKIQDTMNNMARNVAISPNGLLDPPTKPEKIDVKISGEMAHVSITHNSPIQKGVQYITLVSPNDPSFGRPLVIDHGASRTSHPFLLPTNDDDGSPVTYYFKSLAQYHGSLPSEAVVYGGDTPQGVTMGGSTNLSLLPSNGAGTAKADGSQGDHGLGRVLDRPAIGPKRAQMS